MYIHTKLLREHLKYTQFFFVKYITVKLGKRMRDLYEQVSMIHCKVKKKRQVTKQYVVRPHLKIHT